MERKAKRKNKNAVLLTALFTLLTATGMFYIVLSDTYFYAIEFLTLLSAIAALTVAGRYLLVEYLYVVRESESGAYEFLVVEQKGKRNKIVCRIFTSDITEILEEASMTREALKERRRNVKRHDYCVDLGSRSAVCLFVSEDEAEEMIRISLDERLLSLLRSLTPQRIYREEEKRA
jgi:hypothetical protein